MAVNAAKDGAIGRVFSASALRVLPRAALRPVSLLFLVALTGIEPATLQFSSVQLGLSSCVFSPVESATRAFRALRVAGVVCRWSVAVMRRPPGRARGPRSPCKASGSYWPASLTTPPQEFQLSGGPGLERSLRIPPLVWTSDSPLSGW